MTTYSDDEFRPEPEGEFSGAQHTDSGAEPNEFVEAEHTEFTGAGAGDTFETAEDAQFEAPMTEMPTVEQTEDFAAQGGLTTTVPERAHQGEKYTPEQLGQQALKLIADTAYAAAGAATTLVEKAREYYDQQRKEAAAANDESSTQFKTFVQVPDQVKKMLDDLAKGYQDLADKGRHAFKRDDLPKHEQPKADEF